MSTPTGDGLAAMAPLAPPDQLVLTAPDAPPAIAETQAPSIAPQVSAEAVPALDAKVDEFMTALEKAESKCPDFARQAEIVRAVVDHVVIGPGSPGARSVDPARVQPVWRL